MKRKFIRPTTTFGKGLLNTVPTKVFALLLLWGLKNKPNTEGPVTWDIRGKRISLTQTTGQVDTIVWSGPAKKPQDVRFLDNEASRWIETIETNLDRFVELEQIIYTAVEEFAQRERAPVETPQELHDRLENVRNLSSLPSTEG